MKWLVNNIHTVRNNCKRQNLITSSTTFLNSQEKKKFFHSTSSKNNNNYVKTIPKPPKTHQVTKSIVCFRHGDRSASHNLFEPDSELAVQEALAWSLELPMKTQVKELNNLAPIERSETTLLPRDAELGVFGKLTVKGIKQAHRLGRWLGNQYIAKRTFTTRSMP